MLFYVYALARPVKKDWRIFYIGKGSKRRVFAHEGEARSGHNCHKCNVIRKVWRESGEIQRYILLTTEDEAEAFAYEREMIALHGRENLCNHTEGGDGASGAVVSEETRTKKRLNMLERYANPAERIRQSLRTKVSWGDQAIREKRMIGLRKAQLTATYRAKMSKQARAVWGKPEHRAKMTEMLRIEWTNPESRAKRIAGIKATAATPEDKARRSAKSIAVQNTPEAKARQSERSKEMWKDPGRLARASAKRSTTQSTPEARAHRAELNKKMWKDPERLARANAKRKATFARKRAERGR